MSTPFVHLHVHTEYSLVDGIVRIAPLVKAAAAAGMPAVAVTEQVNLFSLVKFYRAAISRGVKPVIGVDFTVHNARDPSHPSRLVLLCQNATGYRTLTRLVSRAYTEGQVRGGPMLRANWLEDGTDGLIALSGAAAGEVGLAVLAGRPEQARERLDRWLELFPDRFYLELQRTGREGEEQYVEGALELARVASAPVVATNDVRFLAPEDFEAHEARVCIYLGRTLNDPRRPRSYSEQQFLRSSEEMARLFADVPEAIANSVEIARRCSVELRLGQSYLPAFPVPGGAELAPWFVNEAREGLERRHTTAARAGRDVPPEDRSIYAERLQRELDVIIEMGFAGYFSIVADFVRWAREHGVPVGPGRGSGAGSLVAYALGITDLDPIEYDLLFERFLNPERVSLPDFDIDFCMEGRDRVIEYVTARYGGENEGDVRVAQIITFGTMAARAVVRDVGRVLGYPFGFVDQLAKLIPFELGMTLKRALEEEEALRTRYDTEEEVRTLIDLARTLEGIARNAGRHAGGVVIAPSALTDFAPLYCEYGASSLVTQFDKDDVETIGLVKFDFLGLRTLTIIDRAVAQINGQRRAEGEPSLDVSGIPTDDAATYDLIKRGATTAVFQLESRGMKDLIRRLQPDCFDDIVALVALFRPGPLQSGMVDDFIDRKHGRAPVSYLLPDLEPILKPTYGVILYQEQVMQIAQVLAGYTLGGADLLRSAMGKKKPKEMAKQRRVFVEGALARGVDHSQASFIFDLMEKFAGYGFNKAHSTAYALVAYQTAWLKTHYPAEFMAAVLSADMDNTDKVITLIEESKALGLEVRLPDVNRCAYAFEAESSNAIRYGLGAIKGVGEGAVAGVVEERRNNGSYADLFDFCRRIDSRRTNRRVIESLIRAGALDGLGPSRAAMMATLTHALQMAEQHSRDASAGQNDMFGGAMVPEMGARQFADCEEWSQEQRLAGEKETLGLYLTGHPITRHEPEIEHIVSARLGALAAQAGRSHVIAGLVVGVRTHNSRNGRMAVVTLDDRTARLEAVVYSELFRVHRDLLVKDRLLVLEGEVAVDEFTGAPSMIVSGLHDLDDARRAYAKRLALRLEDGVVATGLIEELAAVLKPFLAGSTPVCIDYIRRDASVRMPLGDAWRVNPKEELLQRLRELAGPDGVHVEYS